MEEDKNTTKGSGNWKTSDKIKNLRSADLISQLKELTTHELAEKYEVNLAQVLAELSQQFKQRRIGFGYVKAQDREEEDQECAGAWMASAERSTYRAVLINYNLYLNQKKDER